jgi:pyruvate kinase
MKNAIYRSLPPGSNSLGFSYPKTRIMATVGKKSNTYEIVKKMVEYGVSIFRINGGHLTSVSDSKEELTYEEAEGIIKIIRRIRDEQRQVIGIYFDLAGPKIRVSNVLSVNKKKTEKEGNDKKEGVNLLHPSKGDRVIIIPFNQKMTDEFNNSLSGFEQTLGNSKLNQSRLDWGEAADVREFFNCKQIEEFHKLFKILKENSRDYVIMLRDIESEFAAKDFMKGGKINLKDGLCTVEIEQNYRAYLECKVTEVRSSFEFRPGQGVNPYQYIFPQIITPKDEEDIEFALKIGADIISQSFVCHPDDAKKLREVIKRKKDKLNNPKFLEDKSDDYKRYISCDFEIPIYAKIETVFAVSNAQNLRFVQNQNGYTVLESQDPLREIVQAFDGIMVARGDLAVETSKVEVPELQEQTIKWCRSYNKPVIVATEVLDSMKKGDASTRAEIDSIIKTVKYEIPDILMLSGETASTKGEPDEAVRELCIAIAEAEKNMLKRDEAKNLEALFVERMIIDKKIDETRFSNGQQVCHTARAIKSNIIVVSVTSGEAARDIAYFRPSQKILAITGDILTAVGLLPYRGIYPIVLQKNFSRDLDSFLEILLLITREKGLPTQVYNENDSYYKVPGLIRLVPPRFSENHPDALEETPNTIFTFKLPIDKKNKDMKQEKSTNGNGKSTVDVKGIETELKYLLSEENYEILLIELQKDSNYWNASKQSNYYYHDSGMMLSQKKKISLRIRREKKQILVDGICKDDDRDTVGQYYFTYKEKSKKQDSGFQERVEIEYDITREVYEMYKSMAKEGEDFIITDDPIDFNKLSEFYKEVAFGPFKEEVLKIYQSESGLEINNVVFSLITSMKNLRYTFEMHNKFILELDKTEYFDEKGKPCYRYELEIELGVDTPKSVEIEIKEYIHDKFALLDIPILCPDDYPSKALIAYSYSGSEVLSDKAIEHYKSCLAEMDTQTRLSHIELCEACKELKNTRNKIKMKAK